MCQQPCFPHPPVRARNLNPMYLIQTSILFSRSSNKLVSNSSKCKFTYFPAEPTTVLVSNQGSSVTKPFNLVHTFCIETPALFSRALPYCGLCWQCGSKFLRNTMRMRRITLSYVACPALLYFSTLSPKRYDFRKESYRT